MPKILRNLLLVISLLISFCLSTPAVNASTTEITDWYIQDFQSNIILNKNDTVTITEDITADCGNLPNKHGIFRVIPKRIYIDKKKISTPIKLISITDFNDVSIPFATINDNWNHSLTWKIGDPNKTVQGINQYRIKYTVGKVVRFNTDKDEFYWNLNGNFWDITTDKFTANIHFPSEISESNSQLHLYAGTYGNDITDMAKSSWTSPNLLRVESTRKLEPGEGITISLTFPKNIIAPYKPTPNEYLPYFYYLIPLITLILCFSLWQHFGRDPKTNPTIAPEFAPPIKLSPLEIGMLYTNGLLKNEYITATIISLAVKKIVTLENIPKKGLLGQEDYFIKLDSNQYTNADDNEKIILNGMFASNMGNPGVLLSALKNQFYSHLPTLNDNVTNSLKSRKLLDSSGRTYQYILLFVGIFSIGFSFALYNIATQLTWAIFTSGIIITFFSFLMPRRTSTGLTAFKQIQGFKLYMETAEKYRQQFFEKENIFETLLPYAIMFGITSQWIKTTRNIYQQSHQKDYFTTYHPIWFVGTGITNFNIDSFSSHLNNLTHSMSSTMSSTPSSSGSGGGGFSGGGGGGGGGRGW